MPRYEEEGRGDHSPLHVQDRLGRPSGSSTERRPIRPPSPERRRPRDYSPSGASRSHHYRDYDDMYAGHHPSHSTSGHYRHDSSTAVPPQTQRRSLPYKILCVLNLNSKVSDGNIRDALTREFSRFGDVSVKVCFDGNERLAYAYFRCYEDAREARHARARMVLFDRQIEIDPIYDRSLMSSSSSSASSARRRSGSPSNYSRRRDASPSHSRRLTLPPHMRNQERGYERTSSSQSDIPSSHRDHYSHREDREYHESHRSGSVSAAASSTNGSNGSKSRDSKKEKFPNYLHHVAPEDDDKATRTLFVGNLEVSISDPDLRKIFERYGSVVDIDVKRPAPGQGNAYAFIKFLNLDMAHRAKVEMSGQYIGKFQCKIGYGKATPTTRIWVGGLGSWTSLAALEREFDRFGIITKIDFVRGDNHAYIQYDSIDAAQCACQEMRGFPLGGQDRRLRVDFADAGPYSTEGAPVSPSEKADAVGTTTVVVRRPGDPEADLPLGSSPSQGNHIKAGSEPKEDLTNNKNGSQSWSEDTDGTSNRRPHSTDGDEPTSKRRRQDLTEESSEAEANSDPISRTVVVSAVTNLSDLITVCPPTWTGAMVLKNSAFATKMLLCSGDVTLVDSLLKTVELPVKVEEDSSSKTGSTINSFLRITQRLRLDPSKLEDVSRRMSSAGSRGHCVLLAVPSSATCPKEASSEVMSQRPLKNLVVYLKQKNAAGVISLTAGPANTSSEESTQVTGKEVIGVVYAFPPSDFALDLLKKIAPNFSCESPKEDYLVVVVVKGSN